MKKISAILLLAVAGLLTGCWEKQIRSNPNDPLLRYHFAGMKAVLQGTNGTRLQKVWAMPDTAALKEEALTKLARVPFHVLQSALPQGAGDQAELLKPLLDDLVNSEHFVEVKSASEKVEFVVGVRLAEDRAKAWDASLQKLAKGWKFSNPAPGNISGPKGWETKGNAGQIAFTRAGDWTFLSFGTVPTFKLLPELTSKAAKSGAVVGNLDGALLDLNADLPRLRKWVPLFADYPLPPAHLRVLGKGESLRTELRLLYSENIPWTPEPWVFPRKAINDPLVCFTVGQGLAQILGDVKVIRDLGVKQLPNQFCMWGLEHNFPMTYLAFPTANATNFINQVAPTLPKQASQIMTNHMGDFFWSSNRAEISWRNIPFVTPHIYPYTEGGKQFVMADIYPRPPLTNPPPPELFAEIQGKQKLLYYDWEISQERLFHANQLYQLYDILNNRRPEDTNVLAQRWVLGVATNLANTITEVTMPSQKEIFLVRKSQVGFTGFELVTLARWIRSKNFPFEFDPAPAMKQRSINAANQASRPGSTTQKGGSAPTKQGTPPVK